ncbi:putative inactive receptor kinase At2g26730 [Tasmannia lanceolata]|uniref:putative inactive receptor kinase At2g26730 n=1 Tax=Tasmannia lanceolata TaxID=3420 RepID=UPI0040638B58
MKPIPLWVLPISLLLLFNPSNSADDVVKQTLLNFFKNLSNGNIPKDPKFFGWNSSSDPCSWQGINCDTQLSVKRVVLENLELSGILDTNSICSVSSLTVLSAQNNSIHGGIPSEILNCKRLTHLYLNNNQFSGNLPESLSRLNNLKRLFVFNNNFSGNLPDLPKISGLLSFLAQNNQLTGEIPQFNFENLVAFNVSFNNFSGPVPELGGRFGTNSLIGNSGLCGKLVEKLCPPPVSEKVSPKKRDVERVLMFLGYSLLALVFIMFFTFKIIFRKKTKGKEVEHKKKKAVMDSPINHSSETNDSKTPMSKSEYSMASSNESDMMSSSLVVLTNPAMKELKFEDLLRAPAELLGRGRYGCLYKVMFDDGINLAVKRIKDWTISPEDFQKRMRTIDQAKHPNVLPVVAFYCAKQEKLVVYEYQKNGSLFQILQGGESGKFYWDSRLSVASSIAEGLAFMHKELYEDGISHGNLKSSNILMNKNMDPCISEYGLMAVDSPAPSPVGHANKSMNQRRGRPDYPFKADIFNFGVILLELLTGKLAQNNGLNLANWVHSAVREEWTVEVFDKALVTEGASEERMVSLLQVALKCLNPSPESRPNLNQVVTMINTIKEEEEMPSIVSEP